jgi:CRP/FNR family transcriptional regulator, cyclic AMP receptor protein
MIIQTPHNGRPVTNNGTPALRCLDCVGSSPGSFCELPEKELSALRGIRIDRNFSKGDTVITEGQPAKGVFIVCDGRVKLSTCSRDGRTMILGIAGRGELIGLCAVLAGTEYETTGEAIDNGRMSFVPAGDLISFLNTHPAAAVSAARQLGRKYLDAHRKVCAFGMSEPVLVKLAKLILDWCSHPAPVEAPVRLTNSFTHEEIAEMIGASRETVTRTLREMRERGLVTLKGSDLVIHDWHSLSITAGRFCRT